MFRKGPITIEEQITLLNKRGLDIPDSKATEKYLENISCYRLGEYWHVMQSDKEKHTFKPNSKFLDVIGLYHFDAELRLLLFGVIEKISSCRRESFRHDNRLDRMNLFGASDYE